MPCYFNIPSENENFIGEKCSAKKIAVLGKMKNIII